MDDRLRREIRELAAELATKESLRLKQALTLIDIEVLTAEIGDEIARQLDRTAAASRSNHRKPEPSMPRLRASLPAAPRPGTHHPRRHSR